MNAGQRPASQPADTSDLPELVRRAGRFLLRILSREYTTGGREVPICELRYDQAVDLCKEQLLKFYRVEAPFNRPLYPNEGPREWWEALNTDRTYKTQPLAVCNISQLPMMETDILVFCVKQLMTWIFGVTPNSMSDERTASYFTWQNSSLRGSQNVPTLVRMAQISQYEKMKSMVRVLSYPDINNLLIRHYTFIRILIIKR